MGLKRYFPAENITRWILIRHGYKVWPLLVVGCNIHNDKWTDFCRVHRLRVGLCFFACERHWIFNTFMFNENGHECVTLGRIQLNPYSNCMISQVLFYTSLLSCLLLNFFYYLSIYIYEWFFIWFVTWSTNFMPSIIY